MLTLGNADDKGQSGETAPETPQKTGNGAWNNWAQPVSRAEVPPPNDLDRSRPSDDAAPLGYLSDGRPWSPYGTRPKTGKPRSRPAPSLSGRDRHLAAAPGESVAPIRLAPGPKKAAGEVVNPYAALEASHKHQKALVDAIKKQHPGTKIGDAVHPKAVGAGEIVRAEPTVGAATIEGLLVTATAYLAAKLEAPHVIPKPAAVHEAGIKLADASRYYGLDTSPKAAATWAAVIAVVVVFLPSILEGVNQLIRTIKGLPRVEARKAEVAE